MILKGCKLQYSTERTIYQLQTPNYKANVNYNYNFSCLFNSENSYSTIFVFSKRYFYFRTCPKMGLKSCRLMKKCPFSNCSDLIALHCEGGYESNQFFSYSPLLKSENSAIFVHFEFMPYIGSTSLQGCVKFLIPLQGGGEKFIKSNGEEYQVMKRGRKYHVVGKNIIVPIILRLLGTISNGEKGK